MKNFEVTFLGTNGSCAYNNGKRTRFGTNTLCVAMKVGESVLIFDAGSGICGLNELKEYQKENINLFLSHYHYDHLNGLLFWDAVFDPHKAINIYGIESVREAIIGSLEKPYQPAGIEEFNAKFNFYNVRDNDEIIIGDITVKAMRVSHPGGSMGYRVNHYGKSVCILSDIELANHKDDIFLTDFLEGADLLITDSAYEDGKCIKGWGHSSPSECAELALRSSVKRLALIHYSFSATDDQILGLEESAKKIFANSFASADNQCVKV